MLVKSTNISQPGRMNEHFGKDCLNAFSHDWFSILDTARAKLQLPIKESLFINCLKPTLNKPTSRQYIISLSI